uniref:protein FRG2-like-1 n=1 Tax=Jaculus jaculus TaxID=51337 RepID=UPI0003332867|nr:protein FRG2-like-1 [Jaculus jaculus]
MELGADYPDPFCPPMHRHTLKKFTLKEGRSGEEKQSKEKGPEPNENENSKRENSKEEDVKEMELSSRTHTVRSESVLSSDGGPTRKRKTRSEDRSQVQAGNERSSSLKRRQTTSGRRSTAQKHAGFRRSREADVGASPPPLRKSLVRTLRAMSEAIYQDAAQAEALQARALLGWEQLSALRQLWGPLHSTMQTFYTLANQAAWTVPAEGWLLPAPASAPERASGKDAQSAALEGAGEAADAVSKADIEADET